MKICLSCGEDKSLKDFYKNTRGKQGVGSYCKSCTKLKTVERRNLVGRKDIKNINGTTVSLLLKGAKDRAKAKNLLFDLDKGWVSKYINLPCPMTDLTYILDKRYHPLTPSIDRIDPNKGYTKDNCRLVCYWYNTAKNSWTDEQVMFMAKTLIYNDEVMDV